MSRLKSFSVNLTACVMRQPPSARTRKWGRICDDSGSVFSDEAKWTQVKPNWLTFMDRVGERRLLNWRALPLPLPLPLDFTQTHTKTSTSGPAFMKVSLPLLTVSTYDSMLCSTCYWRMWCLVFRKIQNVDFCLFFLHHTAARSVFIRAATSGYVHLSVDYFCD